MQIPIVSPAEAADLALKYRKQGFQTLKLKVGKDLKADIEVLRAIRAVHPTCSFILDANEGYKSSEAILVLDKLHGKECYGRAKSIFVMPGSKSQQIMNLLFLSPLFA